MCMIVTSWNRQSRIAYKIFKRLKGCPTYVFPVLSGQGSARIYTKNYATPSYYEHSSDLQLDAVSTTNYRLEAGAFHAFLDYADALEYFHVVQESYLNSVTELWRVELSGVIFLGVHQGMGKEFNNRPCVAGTAMKPVKRILRHTPKREENT